MLVLRGAHEFGQGWTCIVAEFRQRGDGQFPHVDLGITQRFSEHLHSLALRRLAGSSKIRCGVARFSAT